MIAPNALLYLADKYPNFANLALSALFLWNLRKLRNALKSSDKRLRSVLQWVLSVQSQLHDFKTKYRLNSSEYKLVTREIAASNLILSEAKIGTNPVTTKRSQVSSSSG